MAHNMQMTDRFRGAFAEFGADVVEKNMFGSLGFMVNDKLAVCVREPNVMFKFSAARRDELIEQGIAAPVVMGKRTMKNWVFIENGLLTDKAAFDGYLAEALKESST